MDDEWAADQLPAHNWATYKEDIIAEQVKQLYALVPFGIVATILNSVIVCFILKDVIPHGMLFAWLATIMVITMFRIALTILFQRTKFPPATARVWGNRFIAGLALSGIAWGIIGIFPFSGVSIAHQVFIAFALGGMAAGASATFSISKAGYLAYSIPALVPLAVRFFLMNDTFHFAMGVMLSLYGLLLWRISRRHYLVNSTSLLLRFENRGMIDQLRSSKENAEKLYNELLTETDAKLKAEAELRAHHNHLERVVEERTWELRQSEERLRDSEATLRLAIESTGLGTFDFHPLTGELVWSDLAKLHFGLPPEAHADYNIFVSGLHPEDRDRVNDIVQKVLRVELDGTYSTEYRTIGIQDRKERWLAAHGRVFFSESGEPVRLIGTTMDITERKLAEQERERLISELERSNKELQQFAYVASHDLQEPLRTITNFVELLDSRYKGKLDEDADKYIGFVVEGANRMLLLIDDLLTYSRVGTCAKQFGMVEMNSILTQAIESLKSSIKESNAEITSDELPAVEGNETQLVQLLQNLLSNAIKFRRKDVAPSIHISAERKGNEWIFGVHDNGIGLKSRFYERIFTIFQRLHTREEYPGTGIGLAISRRIVERHKGRVWVESKLGEGSSFYFTFPVRSEG